MNWAMETRISAPVGCPGMSLKPRAAGLPVNMSTRAEHMLVCKSTCHKITLGYGWCLVCRCQQALGGGCLHAWLG